MARTSKKDWLDMAYMFFEDANEYELAALQYRFPKTITRREENGALIVTAHFEGYNISDLQYMINLMSGKAG